MPGPKGAREASMGRTGEHIEKAARPGPKQTAATPTGEEAGD